MSESSGEHPNIIAKRGAKEGGVSESYVRWRREKLGGILEEAGGDKTKAWKKEEFGKTTTVGILARKVLAQKLSMERTVQRHEKSTNFDELTGLLNGQSGRTYLESKLAERRGSEQSSGIGVVGVDIDYFSWWNDLFSSHSLGSLVLASVGDFLQSHLRPNDLAIRLHGEEFLMVLDNVSQENIDSYSERIRKNAEQYLLDNIIKSKLLLSNQRKLVEHLRPDDQLDTTALSAMKKLDKVSIVLEQLTAGLLEFESNKKEEFLKSMKGDDEKKQSVVEAMEQLLSGESHKGFDSNLLRFYLEKLSGNYVDLGFNERRKKIEIEIFLARVVIPRIFRNITFSVGGVYIEKVDEGVTVEKITGAVDKQVYKAKRKGRNQCAVTTL